jgi:hypothetical protein
VLPGSFQELTVKCTSTRFMVGNYQVILALQKSGQDFLRIQTGHSSCSWKFTSNINTGNHYGDFRKIGCEPVRRKVLRNFRMSLLLACVAYPCLNLFFGITYEVKERLQDWGIWGEEVNLIANLLAIPRRTLN